jgi:hypothetical protein
MKSWIDYFETTSSYVHDLQVFNCRAITLERSKCSLKYPYETLQSILVQIIISHKMIPLLCTQAILCIGDPVNQP